MKRKQSDFLIQNFNSLPEDLQRSLTLYLFEESLKDMEELETMKLETMEIFEFLQKVKKRIEEQKKIIEIKESLENQE
ncbi:MAG: hypothetical protein NZ822_01045 [Patescibacteria group bacterium]|nr:hypothetical protein [Patescibacteria group bacterium]